MVDHSGGKTEFVSSILSIQIESISTDEIAVVNLKAEDLDTALVTLNNNSQQIWFR